jgi:hypothetical protein
MWLSDNCNPATRRSRENKLDLRSHQGNLGVGAVRNAQSSWFLVGQGMEEQKIRLQSSSSLRGGCSVATLRDSNYEAAYSCIQQGC